MNNGNKSSEGSSPDPVAVKELFGMLLDAAEAFASDDGDAIEVDAIAKRALEESDPGVRIAAEKLLEAHKRADSGLFCEMSKPDEELDASVGTVLEPPVIEGYVIGGEIGRGGFGVVYRGEQLVPVKRLVAIKILRTDLATAEMVSRFRAEASLLARMNHEGIARVIDAGLDDTNRPYVVMDLIEGEPIVSYCEGHGLSVRDRVELFERVCDAVHHAHQRAVIHRDLKPANVMVETRDGVVRPRVIDFGIAKLLEDGGGEMHTMTGQRLGTPKYMSPEQRSGEGAVDIRIDVYALGVLLCEVLTGEVPYGETRSRTSSTAGTRPSVLAAGGGADRLPLVQELKGDLDQIVTKAAAGDPDMRYQSAAAMSEDLRRYLDGMPVLAKDAGVVYRGMKFVQRHKLASSLACVALIGLVLGGVGLAVGLNRATASRNIAHLALEDAERQLLRAEFVNRFLLEDMLAAIDPNVSQGRDVTVREVFDIASERLSEREDLDLETQYTTLRLIGMVHSEVGAHDEAMGAFERAAELAERYHGGLCREAIEIRMNLFDLIVANGRSGRTKLGEELNSDARAVLEPNDELYRSVRVRTSDSIEELSGLIVDFENDPGSDPRERLKAITSLANLYSFAFMADEELDARRRGYELSNEIYGPDHSSTFNRLGHYAALRVRTHPDEKTLELLYQAYEPARRILGVEHPVTLSSMRVYANLLGKLKDQAGAIELLEECERGYRARFGASSTYHTGACSVLGEHYLRAGRAEEALELLLQVREDRARQWSRGHVNNVVAHLNVAECYLALGDGEAARAESLAMLKIAKPESLRAAQALLIQARALVMLGLDQEAVGQAELAHGILNSLEPSPLYFEVGEDLVALLESLGFFSGAQDLMEMLGRSKGAP